MRVTEDIYFLFGIIIGLLIISFFMVYKALTQLFFYLLTREQDKKNAVTAAERILKEAKQ